MRRFLTLESIQRRPTDLARLHRRLAVLVQVLSRCRVVVNSMNPLGWSSAEYAVCEQEVRDQVGSRVVGWLRLARGGAETQCAEDGE